MHEEYCSIFQSTLPLRGATPSKRDLILAHCKFQSTLPLRGATDAEEEPPDADEISIHTPLAGSDALARFRFPLMPGISIHTPLAGSDRRRPRACVRGHDFNPHSPCGERRDHIVNGLRITKFQSTLPLRGATTACRTSARSRIQFQSTLPLQGATIGVSQPHDGDIFQSTLPLRGATQSLLIQYGVV